MYVLLHLKNKSKVDSRNASKGSDNNLIQVTDFICLFNYQWGDITSQKHGLALGAMGVH